MDPLKIFEQYYERDNEALGTLDGIIDTAENEFKAADTFLAAENNFKVKKPVVRESIDDEAVEIEDVKKSWMIQMMISFFTRWSCWF